MKIGDLKKKCFDRNVCKETDVFKLSFPVQVCEMTFMLVSASASYMTLIPTLANYTGKTSLIEYAIGGCYGGILWHLYAIMCRTWSGFTIHGLVKLTYFMLGIDGEWMMWKQKNLTWDGLEIWITFFSCKFTYTLWDNNAKLKEREREREREKEREWIKSGTLKWFGYVMMVNENELVKRYNCWEWSWKPNAGGRPPVNWMNRVNEYWRERDGRRSLDHALKEYQTRQRWRFLPRSPT